MIQVNYLSETRHILLELRRKRQKLKENYQLISNFLIHGITSPGSEKVYA